MSRDFVGALLQLNAEKQVPKEQLIRTIEEAIEAAWRRTDGVEDIHVQIDADTGKIRAYRARTVVEEIEDPLSEFTLEEAKVLQGRRQRGRSRGDRGARSEPLRTHPRPDRQAGRPAAPA